MKITLLTVGKTNNAFVSEGVQFYDKRIRKYERIEIIDIKRKKYSIKTPTSIIKEQEAAQILQKLPEKCYIVALDEHGKSYTSVEFSEWLTVKKNNVQIPLVFIVGGPFGLHKKIIEKSNETLALSKMTFPHELIRVFLLEQLYRAFSIMQNENYHKP